MMFNPQLCHIVLSTTRGLRYFFVENFNEQLLLIFVHKPVDFKIKLQIYIEEWENSICFLFLVLM